MPTGSADFSISILISSPPFSLISESTFFLLTAPVIVAGCARDDGNAQREVDVLNLRNNRFETIPLTELLEESSELPGLDQVVSVMEHGFSEPPHFKIGRPRFTDDDLASLIGCYVDKMGLATEADLIAFSRQTLAGFKAPKRVVFQELPKTSTGKIQKFELRQIAAGIS